MHIYKGYQYDPYKGDGSERPATREDLERRYEETHRTAAKPAKQKGSWLERHSALLMVALSVVVAIIGLACWIFTPLDMIVPMLAAILVYLGFLTGMVLL